MNELKLILIFRNGRKHRYSKTYQRGGVSRYVVVEASHKSGESKVRDFADQVGVDQHVSSR